VYRAWDPELRRDVAIKVTRPELMTGTGSRGRVLCEAQSAARLRHPAVVPIHEVGQDGEHTFIVYEYVPGPTLAALLPALHAEIRSGPPMWPQLLQIGQTTSVKVGAVAARAA